jgi:hypothetical protein
LNLRDLIRIISLRKIAVLYSLLLLISWLSPDIVKAYISSIGLVLIPLVIGFTMRVIPDVIQSSRKSYDITFLSLFSWWMLGLIGLTLSSAIVSVIWAPFTILWTLIFNIVGLLFCIIWGCRASSSPISLNKKTIFSILILATGIIMAFWYLRRLSSFPLMLGDDLTNYLTTLSGISHGITGINLYDSGFILLIGDSSILVGAQPLWIFWSGPLIQYTVMAVGIFLLSRKLTNSYPASIVSALVPLWFMGDGTINDLTFFLTRNILMALLPFFILFLFTRENSDETKPSYTFVLSFVLPLLFYLGVSPAFYNTTISHLPNFVQVIFQPGFFFTSPAFTFNMPIAGLQGLYLALILALIILALLRLSMPKERRILISWASVSLVSFMLNYRMGLMLSLILFVFLLVKRVSSRGFLIISILSLSIVSLAFSGFNFSTSSEFLNRIFFQVNSSILSTTQKTNFLLANYTPLFLYFSLFSIVYLTFESIKKSSTTSLLTSLTAVGLCFYFLPIPESERFLIIVTPFLVLLSAITLQKLLKKLEFKRTCNNQHKSSLTTLFARTRSIKNFRKFGETIYNSSKIIKIFVLIFIVFLGLISITRPYETSITNYTSEYGPTGSISSFNENDIRMADWIKANMPLETLIISDPDTIQILSGLSAMPYTMSGRYYLNALNTASLVSGRSDLFRNVLMSLDINSFAELVNLYNASDLIMGFNQHDRQIIAVINNRTTAWLANSFGYQYSSVFTHYEGLNLVNGSSFCKPLYNPSDWYLSFNLTLPKFTIEDGVKLHVQSDKTTIREETTTMSYYDPKFPSYELNLSNASSYVIEGIPKIWSFDNIESSVPSNIILNELDEGSTLSIDNVKFDSKIALHWHLLPVSENEFWKLIEWNNGWETGPMSSQDTGIFNYKTKNTMLNIGLGAGVSGGYTSIINKDLNFSMANESVLYMEANATDNTRLAVSLTLANGQRIFVFNSTDPTFFSLSPSFKLYKQNIIFENSTTLSRIQIFIKSTDGLPCNALIKSIFDTENLG